MFNCHGNENLWQFCIRTVLPIPWLHEGIGTNTRIWLEQILKKELKLGVDWNKVDKEDLQKDS